MRDITDEYCCVGDYGDECLGEELKKEIKKWRALDTEASNYVECVICMRTGFTGDPPYVGWKGLGLALVEALDERDRLRAEVERLRAALVEVDTVLKNLHGLENSSTARLCIARVLKSE